MNESDLKKNMTTNCWKRTPTFVLNFVFLALVGFLLSLPLKPFFIESGAYGLLIGVCICLAYCLLVIVRSRIAKKLEQK